MENKHLFCGILIDNDYAFASVLNQRGKVIACNQYVYKLPEGDFPDILEHLRHFADLHQASIHIAFAHHWDAHVPRDPFCPHDKELLRISHSEFDETNLLNSPYDPDQKYHKPKILALLGALRFASFDSCDDLSLDNSRVA